MTHSYTKHAMQWILIAAIAIVSVMAQHQNRPSASSSSTSISSATATPTPIPTSMTGGSISYTTYTSVFATTLTPGQARPSGVANSQSIILATSIITSTLSFSPTISTPSASASPTTPIKPIGEQSLPLHTNIDPAFGILGTFLIITGLVMGFIGHRSRWLVCLIAGFYSLALITLCVILRVGVSNAQEDPNKSLKGLYLLACLCIGGIGAALAVIFRNGGLLLSCALGGFVFSLFLQACKANGLIEVIGYRYILYVALGTVTFSLACHSRLQSYLLIGSSAHVGATATILGIDCFTRANLKEFYIRNLGFDDLFMKKYPSEFQHNRWFLSTASVIELGVLAGLTVMAISFQSKTWSEFRNSLSMMRHDDEERRLQAKAKRAAKKVFASAQRDLREWEEKHGYRKTGGVVIKDGETDYNVNLVPSSDIVDHHQLDKYERKDSMISLLPFKGQAANNNSTPMLEYRPSTQYEATLAESVGLHRHSQSSPNSPLTLDDDNKDRVNTLKTSLDAITEQEKLLEEIAMIRKSIGALRSTSPNVNADSSEDVATGRFSSASMNRKSRDDPVASSPWLTTTTKTDQRRAHSISTYMQDGPLSTVDHTLFAGPSKNKDYRSLPNSERKEFRYRPFNEPKEGKDVPKQISIPTHVPRNYFEQPLSATLSDQVIPEEGGEPHVEMESGRRLSNQLPSYRQNNLHHHRSTSSPSAGLQVQKKKSIKAMYGMEHAETPSNPDCSSSSPPRNSRLRSKTIVNSKEEAAARFARALHRGNIGGEEKTKSGDKRRATTTTTTTTTEMAAMSVGELHARHQSRLKAMQEPTSRRIEEEAKLNLAKEEWVKRSKYEKRQWEENVKRQQNLIPSRMDAEEAGSTPIGGESKRGSSPGIDMLIQLPKQSGVSRAKEWRRSLVEGEVEKKRSMQRPRAHSSKTLLDFGVEGKEMREMRERGRPF